MSKSTKAFRQPTHEEIAASAQQIYETEGRPEGKAMDHWLRAEAQLIAQRKSEVEAPAAKAPSKAATAWQNNAPRQNPSLHRN